MIACHSILRFALLLAWVPALQAQETDRVVGSIGDLELRQSEVEASLARLDGVEKEALAGDPATLGKLVRSMLVQRLILQEALEKQWDVEPSIQPLLKSTREAAITDTYLKSLCKPPASYPSEAELKAAYESSRDALTVPRSFRLAQIFIGEGSGAEKKLQTLRQRLEDNPAAFGAVAREVSEDKESASRDGEIGWLSEKQIQPEILAQLPKLRVNVISEPVRLKDGWHILKVLDMREPFTPIFDQVRLQLARRLRAEKTRASMQAYMTEMLQKHPVAVNEVALSKLLHESPPGDAVTKP
ncbi:MAG: peptidylprolyl isomerase [Prosthecobacter sp.]|jgi:parvulin-like peptidyl-prolyl isomerase|uniref:peptidylprolyl isomerase n=1 Tax=Prosthecobacter sp. TaxID=1965333 RepID=UPI0019DD6A89|nr:peptidylprolyl isomerase [Prosthecobacter sp.]MBE2285804.1 peptidylprolyl isomerase [Prosthecobacter sp.]